MPVVWWGSFALLAASVALERDRIEAALGMRPRVGAGVSEDLPAPG
jgi:hypothetical protein